MSARAQSKRRRRGRSDERRAVAASDTGEWRFTRRVPTYDYIDEQALDDIHETSMRLVEDVGVDFRDGPALETWKAAGADVQGERVRIPRELLMDLVSHAPETFIHHARNPERNVTIGGNGMAYAPIYGSPYIRDLDGERRYARLEDFHNLVKLAYLSPALNVSGGTVCEPTDVPVAKRHLDMIRAHITLSDKPFMGSVTAPERAEDSIAMCRILFGDDFVDAHTVLVSLINCNSPLVWDSSMLSVVRVYASANQACLISPFIMQGANTPITTAGAMAQLNAEALAGIAYVQLVRAGAPVIYGATLSTVSMQSGSPMYGTTETQVLMYLTAQLARRYKLPMRTGGMRNGSKLADAQAAFESVQTMLPAVMAGGHFFLHSAGWLESGLSACYAKFVMDVDQLTVMQRLMSPPQIDTDALALDAVREIGPGGHFLGCEHTLRYYQTAFFTPSTADVGTYEQWSEEGSRDVYARSIDVARSMLDAYEPPALDPAISEALDAFISKRKEVLPDSVT